MRAIRPTISRPEPSDSRRKIRSPTWGFPNPHGLMGTCGGSGKGAATTSPEPASDGFGVVTVIPSIRCHRLGRARWPSLQRVDRGDQALFDFIGQRNVAGG